MSGGDHKDEQSSIPLPVRWTPPPFHRAPRPGGGLRRQGIDTMPNKFYSLLQKLTQPPVSAPQSHFHPLDREAPPTLYHRLRGAAISVRDSREMEGTRVDYTSTVYSRTVFYYYYISTRDLEQYVQPSNRPTIQRPTVQPSNRSTIQRPTVQPSNSTTIQQSNVQPSNRPTVRPSNRLTVQPDEYSGPPAWHSRSSWGFARSGDDTQHKKVVVPSRFGSMLKMPDLIQLTASQSARPPPTMSA